MTLLPSSSHPCRQEVEYHVVRGQYLSRSDFRNLPVAGCRNYELAVAWIAECRRSLGGISPLTSSTVDGKPYLRHADVETEILRALSRPRVEWFALAERRGSGRLSNEALVFLIRQSRNGDRDLFGRLVHELGDRTVRIAERWAQGFDQDTLDEIVWTIEKEIVDLVLAETPSRQSDFPRSMLWKNADTRHCHFETWLGPSPTKRQSRKGLRSWSLTNDRVRRKSWPNWRMKPCDRTD